ncbi:SDR family oxidoreductase [Pseudomonas sp. D1-2]|uniref:SDR family oxidoreductase n=1 Tax=unclassified Pseudomonas TaxID=196821 RepID=UPI003DA953DC
MASVLPGRHRVRQHKWVRCRCHRQRRAPQPPHRWRTLSPGPIDTPIFSKALGEGRDAYVRAWEQVLPLHRVGTAVEAGAATLFLMTNTFMNGATLNIDGGARLV